MFFCSSKEINRLINKAMSNIFLKVPIEKNWRSQNFDFLSLENLLPGNFWEVPTHVDIIKLENHGNLKIIDPGGKMCVAFLLLWF